KTHSSSSPVLVGSLTPTLQWTFSDPDVGNTQSAYRVIVKNMSDVEEYNSGWVSSSSNTLTIPSGELTRGTTYKWTVATKDNSGAESPFSSSYYIKVNTLPTANITAYSEGFTLPDNIVNMTWTYGDGDSQAQTHFQVVGSKDNWATWSYNSGEIASSATSHQTTPLSNGAWSFAVRVKDGLEWSNWVYRSLNLPNSFEDNNTSGTAFPVAYQNTYNTLISSATDVDWYKYTPTSTGIDRVTLTVPSDKNYDVIIYDSTEKPITAGIGGTGATENIIFEVTAGQVYYIKVFGVDSHFSTSATYGMTLNKMSVNSTTTYQYDSNGNITGKTTVTTRQ
ncbi:glycoside hydrolase family 78 protein, partial [Paenibacillus koleovorans]|uniref:glycoside hydrolase family 78 protein n=1 Tax=Paenibacillus koleovorans TaxID=121608 RepID=UPI001C3FDF33